MFKQIAYKGILLGVITGMLVSLIDSLYMLTPGIHVPLLYPFYMPAFNLLFWSLFGAASGSALWVVSRVITSCAENEHLGWAVGYLVPFTIILVYFGLADTPVLGLFEKVPFSPPVYAYIWPLLALLLLIIRLARFKPAFPFSPQAFIPELLMILLLVHFSANAAQLRIVSMPFAVAAPLLEAIGISKSAFLVSAYLLGILLIFALYFFIFPISGRFQGSAPSPRSPIGKRIIVAGMALALIIAVFYITAGPKRIPELSHHTHNPKPDVPPVILIVLDTVRADHLAAYGYPAVHRHLQALADDALVFDTCIANSSWTLPSHASLFTGLHPNQHGAHGVLGGENVTIDDLAFGLIPRPLHDSFVTLAEILRDNGYRTMGVVANHILLGGNLNLNQGFERYECFGNIGTLSRIFPLRPVSHFFSYLFYLPDIFMDTKRAGQITDRCINAITASTGGPFFLFVNYMDAHEEYCPPRPYNRRYTSKPSPHLYLLEKTMREKLLGRYDTSAWNTFRISQYDGAISYLDDQLGRLFAQLKQSGIYDRALIIVTSDHGELLGEHGWPSHTAPLYEGVVRVPLFVKLPNSRQTGRNVDSKIQLHDLFSTVLTVCGLPVPEGTSGTPFGSTESPAVAEFENASFGQHRVIYEGQYKYFYYERERPRELYNLQKDPREHNNLAEQLPDIADMLHAKLAEWADDHPPRYVTKDAEVPPETLRALKALGYLQ